MGTNYYAVKRVNVCDHCGRADETELHIGKSSGGWCFSLHVHPEEGINTLDDWKRAWSAEGVVIRDEYGDTISADGMHDIIANRSWRTQRYVNDPAWLAANHAVPGPNGLARHAIMPGHCIGHGDGTWDYMIGEFS